MGDPRAGLPWESGCLCGCLDWLILQVPYAVVFEGEPLVLRCRGWYDKVVYKLHYYRDGQALRYFPSSANYTVAQARASDSGRYQCSGTMRIPVESAPLFSAKVAVTVQGGGGLGPRREALGRERLGKGGAGARVAAPGGFSARPRAMSPLRLRSEGAADPQPGRVCVGCVGRWVPLSLTPLLPT